MIKDKQFSGIAYSKMSRLNLYSQNERPDLLDIMGTMSKPARDFFLSIKFNMNWKTNKSTIPGPKSRSESTMRARAMKELVKHKLVRKVRGNSFMVSPFFLVPNKQENEDIAIEEWGILK